MNPKPKSKITLSALFKHIGEDNCKIQWLNAALVGAETDRLGDTKITFATRQVQSGDFLLEGAAPKKVGLIIWLPVDRLPKELRP